MTLKSEMQETGLLQYALNSFAGLSKEDFEQSLPYWRTRVFKKGEYYNEYKSVCSYLGFITMGVFRSYIIDPKTNEEKNVFFYTKNQFVVTFKSFINQVPCDYHTKAMTDATVVYIHIDDLLALYKSSHRWESFGRLLAQEAFNVVIGRTEGLLFKSAEERYLDLTRHHPDICREIPLYHISSYLGIQGPSLSRIRKNMHRK